MLKNLIKAIILGVTVAVFLPLSAFAGTPHTSWGTVTNGQLTDNWTFYVVARPTEKQAGALKSVGGSIVWQTNVGNMPSAWNAGDDSLAFVPRETNAGASNHAGSYAVVSAALTNVNPQKYADATIAPIAIPTATAGAGNVAVAWVLNNSGNVITYNIYRSTSPSSGFVKIGSSATSPYTDSAGSVGATYYYAIEPVFKGSVALGIMSANSASVVYPAQPAIPVISVNPKNLSFNGTAGGSNPTGQTFTISNTGTGTLNWTATKTQSWLSISSASGAAPSSITVTPDITVLAASQTPYTDTITISSNGGNAQIAVTLTLSKTALPTPKVTSILPAAAEVGQTIVITGTDLGTGETGSKVTFGSKAIAGIPVLWSNTSITVAVPSGVTAGDNTVTVTTAGGSDSSAKVTLVGAKIYIDDFEGGAVGSWIDPAKTSGYYTFGAGITPANDKISTDGPQAEAKYEGAKGMKIKYSYDSSSVWGGGWGAALANTLDLTNAKNISFSVKWDNSFNEFKVNLKDNTGTVFSSLASSSVLSTFNNSFGKVILKKDAFQYDKDGSDVGADANFDWSKIVSYSLLYSTKNTATSSHYIDSLAAALTEEAAAPAPVATSEVAINAISPSAGPAGTKITLNGKSFGLSQGASSLTFTNTKLGISYQVEILSWNDSTIEAVVPRMAPVSDKEHPYNLQVTKMSVLAGTVNAQQSNVSAFSVTSSATAGQATVYPNPFNPLSAVTSVGATTIAYNSTGVTNVGVYIFDMSARQIYRTTTSAAQITWNGKDAQGNVVADGVYAVRIVNEDSKQLIARGRVLVIKK